MKNNELIEFLEWDSNFFNMKIGKITKTDFNSSEFKEEQKEKQFDLIYAFCDINTPILGFWETMNFYLVDTAITLSMNFDKDKYKMFDYELKNKLSKKDIESCYEIAESTATVSRFYKEPIIGQEMTKKLYREWIDKALDKSFADGIFVEKIENKIVGIHIIKRKNNTGFFSLTGVKSNLKGKHIGTKLWNQSFGYWANFSEKINLIKSPFSLRNIPSFYFHQAMGFKKIESIQYVYHYSKIKNKNEI
ncbi:MAG: hypothetical protein ABIB46_01185 [bacterium]